VRDAIYALGIGSDLASLTGAKSAGVIGARQLRRIRHPHGSDSPSEPSLANSGAIRSDGRKNPSAYYALA